MGTSKEAFGHDRLNAAGIAKGNRLDGCFCLHKKTLPLTVSGSVFCFSCFVRRSGDLLLVERLADSFAFLTGEVHTIHRFLFAPP